MAKEYIEREAALNEAQEVYHWCGHENRYSDFVPVDAIRAIPAADVVEVVRCKDCEHFRDYTDRHGVVRMNCIRDCHIPQVEPEHFCSYGERRDNNAD